MIFLFEPWSSFCCTTQDCISVYIFSTMMVLVVCHTLPYPGCTVGCLSSHSATVYHTAHLSKENLHKTRWLIHCFLLTEMTGSCQVQLQSLGVWDVLPLISKDLCKTSVFVISFSLVFCLFCSFVVLFMNSALSTLLNSFSTLMSRSCI